jgi:hypothetical protein
LRKPVTPVRGPANGAANGSELELVIMGPVERAVGLWLLPPTLAEETSILICESGGETAWRELLVTFGLAAKAREADSTKADESANPRATETFLIGNILPPGGDRRGRNSIRGAKTLQIRRRRVAILHGGAIR